MRHPLVYQIDPLNRFSVSVEELRAALLSGFATVYSKQGDAFTSYDPASIRWYLSAGTPTEPRVLKRLDGASIVYAPSYISKRLQHVNLGNNWLAFAPSNGNALRSKRAGHRRRWRTPYAAMDVLDREFPCT